MSVINKMLRDLDSRQTGTKPNRSARTDAPAFALGTDVVHGSARASVPNPQRRIVWTVLVALMAGAAGVSLAVFLGWNPFYKPMTVVAKVPTQAPSTATTTATDQVEPSAPVPVVVASAPVPVVPSSAASAPIALLAPPAAAPAAFTPPLPDKPVAKSETSMGAPLKMEIAVAVKAASAPVVMAAPVPAVPRAPASVPVSTPMPMPVPVIPRAPSTIDVLAQAQALWSAGSGPAAVDMLREAVAVTELSPSSTDALAALVRELVRMEMAMGQVPQTLALLIRLEPQLGGQADLWAVRGNAAQRLGRHAESADAYLMALRIRPAEPRWMMGAAVSLAVQGRTSEAAELAEQARNAGPVSPDLLGYLRQLGVRLREP